MVGVFIFFLQNLQFYGKIRREYLIGLVHSCINIFVRVLYKKLQ